MKTSTRIVLPFFHALMEAYAYNSENDSEEHRKTEQKSSECNHNTNQILETLSPNIKIGRASCRERVYVLV